MSNPDRWDERYAEWVVAECLRGDVIRRDLHDAPSGTHDFDVDLRDRGVVAVEVTSLTNGRRLQQSAEIRKRRWEFDGLVHAWHLGVEIGSSVASLHAQAAGLLADLEPSGLTRVPGGEHDLSRLPTAANLAIRRLHALGGRTLFRLDGRGFRAGEVIVAPVDSGGSLRAGHSHLLTELRQHACANVEKLRRARADERHLFLWVCWGAQEALAELGFASVPNAHPHLPDDLDAVWVVEALVPGRVLIFRPEVGWVDLGEWRHPDAAMAS